MRTPRAGRMRRWGANACVLIVLLCTTLNSVAGGQTPFDDVIADLASGDAATRLRAVQMLKGAAYPEAAGPLAKLVTDADDSVQLAAIAAELNIVLAEKIVARRRVGLVIEKRQTVAAAAVFDSGPLAIGPRTVPLEVLDALRVAARDDNPRVRLESTYAFGAAAVEPRGARRRELVRASGRDLAAMVNAVDPYHRYAALRVIGRLLAPHQGDDPLDEYIGDVVINSLNEKDKAMQQAAMQTLGAIRHARAVRGLIDLFAYYGKGEMAVSALDAVAHIGHPSGAPVLVEQLASKNDVLKIIAVEGLARIGDRTKLAAIQTAVGLDRNASLQLAGTFAAVMLGADGTPGLDEIVEALQRSRLHDQAFSYLVEAAPGRPAALARYLIDPDPLVRLDVANVLGLSDDPAALPLAASVVSDPDAEVARAAERAVARLRQVR
jgi:HEAT repeat protein